MTQEEKAKRYDDLLVKLQKAKEDNDVCDERYCCVIDSIAPELKESEDEKIRKEILDYIIKGSESLYDVQQYGKEKFKKWIAWLKKQGETFTKKDVDDAYLKGICDAKHELEKQGEKGINGNEREIPNSAWSEEDLYKIEHALFGTYAVDSATRLLNKIKSLKPQTTWKPSDEQMDAVKSAALDVARFSRSERLRLENEPYYKALISLYQDLKKLREKKL